MAVNRKWPTVDLLKLYSSVTAHEWNKILTKALIHSDVEQLKKLRYGLQAGMDDLAKKKLNSNKIVNWYLRLIRSVENTMKSILRKKYPSPLDNPLQIKRNLEYIGNKRKRDNDFERFLKDTAF